MSRTAGGLRLCFIGDMTSIHVRKWVGFFPPRGHTVRVISSHYYPPDGMPGVEVVNLVAPPQRPIKDALARVGALHAAKKARNAVNRVLPDSVVARRAERTAAVQEAEAVARYVELVQANRGHIAALVAEFQPDILQSLRLFPEGLLAQYADFTPWALMAWGQCISLWADKYPEVAELTAGAVQKCTYYMADNRRDIGDAHRYGLPAHRPWHITPSGGGVETHRLRRPERAASRSAPVFMTFRRTGGFFIDNRPVIRALPELKRAHGLDARFIIYGDRSGPFYEQVRLEAKRFGVSSSVEVRAPFPYARLASTLAEHDLIVSAATYDGTTNALLETMWLGGIPLNGDLEPIREWISDGVNGYTFDMQNPVQIADTFARALNQRHDHAAFRKRNEEIILARGDYETSMKRLEEIYYETAGRVPV